MDEIDQSNSSARVKRRKTDSSVEEIEKDSPIENDLTTESNGSIISQKVCEQCQTTIDDLWEIACPAFHNFCIKCILSWTKHIVEHKIQPKCLIESCQYSMKPDDLDELPVSSKNRQVLISLITQNEKIEPKSTENFRIKCEKCLLYVDQYNHFLHTEKCHGYLAAIPCEICFCPVSVDDYSEHTLICDDHDFNELSRFISKNARDPSVNESIAKQYLKKYLGQSTTSINVYEIVEDISSKTTESKYCQKCYKEISSKNDITINCSARPSICTTCFDNHIHRQMRSSEVLTCICCAYYLQDIDLSHRTIWNADKIADLKKYQDNKVIESYKTMFSDIEENQTTVFQSFCQYCSTEYQYENIFILDCECKICYDCFAASMDLQVLKNEAILVCPYCSTIIKTTDLKNLRLDPNKIAALETYQNDKLFEHETCAHDFCTVPSNTLSNVNQTKLRRNHQNDREHVTTFFNQQNLLPKYWKLPMDSNFTRCVLAKDSSEYNFVANCFFESWKIPVDDLRNIFRSQNRRNFPLVRPQIPPGPLGPPGLPNPPVPNNSMPTCNKSRLLLNRHQQMITSQTTGNVQLNTLPGTSSIGANNENNDKNSTKIVGSNTPSVSFSNMSTDQNLSITRNQRIVPVPPYNQPSDQNTTQSVNSTLYQPDFNQTSASNIPVSNSLNTSLVNPMIQQQQQPYFYGPTSVSGFNQAAFTSAQQNINMVYTQPVNIPASFANNQANFNSGLFDLSNSINYSLTSNNHQRTAAGNQSSVTQNHRSQLNMTSMHRHAQNSGAMQNFSSKLYPPEILYIERIQNQRWFKQYLAHSCEFREDGKPDPMWLFHGCDALASQNIETECFNRSFAGKHAAAFGQGTYFSRYSIYSHRYSVPDLKNVRRMFLARVLIGNTTTGNSSMRVPPKGYDSTGDERTIFVTYHDSQAYAEYLITYRTEID